MVINHFEKVLCFALTVLVASSGFGVVTVFDSNSVIADGDTYDEVLIKGDGTVVTMTGGRVFSLSTIEGSKFIVTGPINAFLNAYDDSTIEISGGAYGYQTAYGSSKIIVSGSGHIDSIYMRGNSQLMVSGASASVTSVISYNNSHLKLVSGSVGSIYLYGDCHIDIEGGIVSDQIVAASSCPVLHISGGSIGPIAWDECGGDISISGGSVSVISSSFFSDTYLPCGAPSLAVIGHDLDAVPYGGNSNNGQITGFWNDDTSFSIDLGLETYGWLTLYDGVLPEECVERPASDLTNDCVVNLDDLNKLASEWLDDGTQ